MEVRFWGTRGSLPASVTAWKIREKMSTALKIALEKGLDKILQDTQKLVTLIEDGKPLRVSIPLGGMVIEV